MTTRWGELGRWAAAAAYGTPSSGSTYFQALSTPATANTKGSYSQLVASTTADIKWLLVLTRGASAGFATCVDLAVGASGSEQVIAANLIGYNGNNDNWALYIVPASIKAGSRLAARGQSDAASDTTGIAVYGFDVDFVADQMSSILDTLGFSTAATNGTNIDPGSTAGTYGSWTQIIASTAADLAGFQIGTDCGHAQAISGDDVDTYFTVEVGVGPSGSEQVILTDFFMDKTWANGGASWGTCSQVTPPYSPLFALAIAAGSRIAVRASPGDSSLTTEQRTVNVTLYGVRQ